MAKCSFQNAQECICLFVGESMTILFRSGIARDTEADQPLGKPTWSPRGTFYKLLRQDRFVRTYTGSEVLRTQKFCKVHCRVKVAYVAVTSLPSTGKKKQIRTIEYSDIFCPYRSQNFLQSVEITCFWSSIFLLVIQCGTPSFQLETKLHTRWELAF